MLPEAIRLVLLHVLVPRYQRDMLDALAGAVPSLAIGLGTGTDGVRG